MILHTLNYTTLDISSQTLNLDNFKIIGKFKVVGSSSNISGHPQEGFQIPFLFENYDSFQIIHYPERYYFRIKDNSNNWLAWQRHKHKIADIDWLQTILDSFNNSISSIQSTLNSHSNSISSIQSTLNSLNARVSALESNSIGLPPGVILSVAWNPNYYVGKRVIPLHGQGFPISSYPELVNATYVGDDLNHIAHFFFKYNSWDGGRNIYGDYFRLPDTKALVPKGRGDLGVGAGYFDGRVKNNSYIMGNLQEDSIQDHRHTRNINNQEENSLSGGNGPWLFQYYSNVTYYWQLWRDYHTGFMRFGRINNHTRDSSFAVDFVITY